MFNLEANVEIIVRIVCEEFLYNRVVRLLKNVLCERAGGKRGLRFEIGRNCVITVL